MSDRAGWWLIIDTTTGAMDGFWKSGLAAGAAMDRRIAGGCTSLALCQIVEHQPGINISDSMKHAEFTRRAG